jgi:hypothetical protein
VLLEGGEEFAWTLAYIMTAEPERFREIMDALRDVVLFWFSGNDLFGMKV